MGGSDESDPGQQPTSFTVVYRSTSFKVIKWCVVGLIVLNLVSSVWVGIYMTNRINRIQRMDEYNTNFEQLERLGHDYKRKAEIWRGIIITVLVITDLICLLAIFGVIREHYCLTMVFGVIMLMYAIFGAAVPHTRGSVSAWVVSFAAGVITLLFGHKIRVEVIHPTIYSTPIDD